MRARSKGVVVMRLPWLVVGLICIAAVAAACDNENFQEEAPPTLRPLSGPTLAASPTVVIRTSGDLYDAETPVLGVSNLTAAALPSRSGLPPIELGTRTPNGAELVQVALADGVIVNGEWYQQGFERLPAILLMSANRADWGALPAQLGQNGYTVLVVDVPTPSAAIADALLVSLGESGSVDPSRLAAGGIGSAADAALLGCVVNPACDAAILISPQARDTLLNVLPSYSPRPLLAVAGRDDASAYPVALALRQSGGDNVAFLDYERGAGADLLATYPTLTGEIAAWLGGVW